MLVDSSPDYCHKVNDLSTISPVASNLITRLGADDVTRSEIIELIEQDEVIYTNVFKFVRSAAFELPRYPRNIAEAFDWLGVHGLKDLIFSIISKKFFMDLEGWRESLLTAKLARYFAEQLNLPDHEASDIFMRAQLELLAQSIFKKFYSNQYAPIESISINSLAEWYQVLDYEALLFGISSLDLTDQIVEKFQLPLSLVDFSDKNLLLVQLAKTMIKAELEDQIDVDQILDDDIVKKYNLTDLKVDLVLLKELSSYIKLL
ncbi:MAG: HDOD domain-containing protein [Candidatus Caenarcaniphilales bacterium]|jgi:hypothetical protein|nr:HDOD domain-containing protein [Candidatus Caenarcaniphilales bacterium]